MRERRYVSYKEVWNLITVENKDLFPLFIMPGLVLGIYVTYVPTLAAKTLQSDDLDYINSRLGLLYFCLGVAEMITGVLFGYILDRFGRKMSLICLLIVMLLGGIFTYAGYFWNSFALFFPAVAFFGMSDCGSHTLVGSVLT